MAACGVCGHDDGSRMADSCWEAQQRMQRAEEQAKVAAVELAALRLREDCARVAKDRYKQQLDDARRENERARKLLARSAERRCDCDDEPAGKVCIPCDARAFLDQRRDEAPRCTCTADLRNPRHADYCPARDEGPRCPTPDLCVDGHGDWCLACDEAPGGD